MKIRLIRAARIRHEAGEIVEVSPAEAGFLFSTGSAEEIRTAAQAIETPEDADTASETPEESAPAIETPEDAAPARETPEVMKACKLVTARKARK